MPHLRLAMAQINATVGDISGNADLVVAWAQKAHGAGAHLALFPETVLTGYPVEDLALRQSFVEASRTSSSDAALVGRITRMVDRAEYKRRQYPPGTTISFKAFGRDRRLPITNGWREGR